MWMGMSYLINLLLSDTKLSSFVYLFAIINNTEKNIFVEIFMDSPAILPDFWHFRLFLKEEYQK